MIKLYIKEFAEIFKNLAKSETNFVDQNNYVENSRMMSNVAKKFDILAINLNVLHNYF